MKNGRQNITAMRQAEVGDCSVAGIMVASRLDIQAIAINIPSGKFKTGKTL